MSLGSMVVILMIPPANSPGIEGDAVLITLMLLSIFDGKMSNENAFRSDSELGKLAPFKKA